MSDNNSFPATQDEQEVFELCDVKITNSPIARAWTRLERSGFVLGPALSEQVDKDTYSLQTFAFGLAYYYSDLEKNPNQVVTFSLGRSLVQESGL